MSRHDASMKNKWAMANQIIKSVILQNYSKNTYSVYVYMIYVL